MGLFSITLLLAFLGLAMDLGNVVVTKSKMQNAVDAAALAGAMQFTSSTVPPSSTDKNNALAKANSILTNNDISVTLTLDTTNPPVVPPPVNTINFAIDGTNNTASRPEINLVLSQNVPTYFVSILGIQSVSMSAQAEAVQKPGGSVPGGGGWAILELGKDSSGTATTGAVTISGNVSVNGNVGVTGDGNVSLSGSCGIDGNLWVNGNGNVDLGSSGHWYGDPLNHSYAVTGSVWDNGSGKLSMEGSSAVQGPAYSTSPKNDSFAWSTSINGQTYAGGHGGGYDGFPPGAVGADASGAVAAVNPYADQALTAYNDFIGLSATGTNANFSNYNGTLSSVPTAINNSGYYHEGVQTITGDGGQNVVNLSSLNISSDGDLTLSAPASGSFIINVVGDMNISGSGGIKLSGGLISDNVTWVHQGTGTVTLGGSTELKGNVLSPNGAINFSGNTFYDGTLITSKGVTLSGSVHSPQNVPWLVPGGGSGGTGAGKVKLIK